MQTRSALACAAVALACLVACRSAPPPRDATSVEDGDLAVPWEEDAPRPAPAAAAAPRAPVPEPAPPGAVPERPPQSAAMAQGTAGLGPEVEIPGLGFQLRLPLGYDKLERLNGPHGSRLFMWHPARRDDGTAPWVMVEVLPMPPDPKDVPSADDYLASRMRAVRRLRSSFDVSEPMTQNVGGLVFRMARWRGVETESGARMFGFVMVTVLPDHVVGISSQDLVPYHRESLPLAERAAQTFRRQSE